MARPRSEDKRNAILAAAIEVIAEQGLGAPTSRIAKLAGVAEGTLFTYFDTKDDLLNQIYLELKAEMREVMMAQYPKAGSLQARARHVWQRFVEWGVANPAKRRALAQLSVSERVSEQAKTAGMQAFADVNLLVQESIAKGVLRDHPPAFISAIMSALAETTMEFMTRDPAHAGRYRNAGFEAFWNAISK
ncbi:TetR/AcrR family transcriptional regulator [Paraburkholderia sp. SARCC-3016]|uniref:TetR/AcrR family transcriptional regulator n=1 Tax=Paraburkholderia sp. SARCC-3016 TaxID=3058611 RepID=UPI0028081A0C|nr:TetR/AcrR family transcriptional regulator [Paraburkholderia sp. SARCC-3016]MDQ7976961.1 TetR/AcrR family transcriptional regulator [Paraburkholderia sp. SARCC-3016]